MWLWQQKNRLKKQLLWAKLFLISFSFHSVFFLWLFFLYRDDGFDIAITVQNKLSASVPVIFVPFAQQKKMIAQNNSSTTQASAPTVSQKKPKTSIQKNTKIIKQKKDQSISVKKKEIKNKTKETQLTHKKKSSIQSQVKQQEKKEAKKQVIASQNKQTATQQITHQEIVQANYREIEAQRRQLLLQKELANYFKPPIGVPADCICQISVAVDWHGVIKELTVIQSSGILMYDVAARSALYTMKMPSWSKGKSLTITFKQ